MIQYINIHNSHEWKTKKYRTKNNISKIPERKLAIWVGGCKAECQQCFEIIPEISEYFLPDRLDTFSHRLKISRQMYIYFKSIIQIFALTGYSP